MTATARKMTPARLRSLFRREVTAARATFRAMGWASAIRGLRNVEVKVSGQLSRAAGSCTFYEARPCLIKLSSKLLCHETATEAHAVEVIRHEIAHAAAGLEAQHGAEWKRACAAIGSTGDVYHDLHAAADAAKPRDRWYTLECACCGESIGNGTTLTGREAARWTRGRVTRCCKVHARRVLVG